MRAKTPTAFASVLIGAIAALSAPADAACKKFGFTVNDYGKEGPTNDAKNLLDKHISEWATQNGVGEYSTGKKSVSCELFLDVILFDEHTCTASATVCWGPDAKKLGTQSAAAPAEEGASGAPPAPIRKAHALGQEAQQAAAAPAASAPADAAPAQADAAPAQAEAAQVDAAPTQPVEQIAAPAEAPPAAPAVHAATAPTAPAAPANAGGTTGAVVETGALQAGQALPQTAAQHAPKAQAISEKDRAAAAAAAASAAAAAERAAMAAETAANAAKEAAAAAVAASAASKGAATVPPLDHASGAKPVHNE